MTDDERPYRPPTYSGWQREKGSMFFGLDGVQTTVLIIAALLVLFPLVAHSALAAAFTLPVAGLLAGAASLRIEGRVPVQWLRLWVSFCWVHFRGAHQFRSQPRYQVLSDDDNLGWP